MSSKMEREIAEIQHSPGARPQPLSPAGLARVRPREELISVARAAAARVLEGRKRPPGKPAIQKATSAAFDAIHRHDPLVGTSHHPHAAYSHGVHALAVEGVEAARRAWEQEHASRPPARPRSTRQGSSSPRAPKTSAGTPRVAYRLQLTPDEIRAVEVARGRYAWADMLSTHATESGLVAFSESEMQHWVDDVDSDDSPFALASDQFAEKLQRFYHEQI